MDKEKIVKIFKEIAGKAESGYVGIYYNMTCSTMPFTTVIDYMEFTNKSELEFSYKPFINVELTPSIMIDSEDVKNITLTECEESELAGNYKIKFELNADVCVIATVELKESEHFELLELQKIQEV